MRKNISAGLLILIFALFITGCTGKKEEAQKTEVTPQASAAAQPTPTQEPPKSAVVTAKEKPTTTVAQAPATSVPTAPAKPPEPSPAPVVTATSVLPSGDPEKGALVFKNTCQACHGQGGDAGNKGGIKTAANFANLDANIPRIKDLLSNLTVADQIKIVKLGGTKSGVKGAGAAMAGFGTVLKEDQIANVVAYERTLPAFKNSPK